MIICLPCPQAVNHAQTQAQAQKQEEAVLKLWDQRVNDGVRQPLVTCQDFDLSADHGELAPTEAFFGTPRTCTYDSFSPDVA